MRILRLDDLREKHPCCQESFQSLFELVVGPLRSLRFETKFESLSRGGTRATRHLAECFPRCCSSKSVRAKKSLPDFFARTDWAPVGRIVVAGGDLQLDDHRSPFATTSMDTHLKHYSYVLSHFKRRCNTMEAVFPRLELERQDVGRL